jgi:hypothetical protein
MRDFLALYSVDMARWQDSAHRSISVKMKKIIKNEEESFSQMMRSVKYVKVKASRNKILLQCVVVAATCAPMLFLLYGGVLLLVGSIAISFFCKEIRN